MSSHSDSLFPVLDFETEIEKLINQRELLDAAELFTQMGHCQWDYRNNRLISCSRGYARIFNMSVAEIIALQNDWEQSLAQIHPDDRKMYLEAYHSQKKSGHYSVEYRMFRNDDQIRWLRETGILKSDDEGQIVDAFAILQDVTERVLHERELEDQQELGRQVENITDSGYFINDEENDLFLYISPGYARIHGRSVAEFMQFVETRKDNLSAVHDEDRENLRAEIKDYIKSGADSFDHEYRITRPDGEVVWVRERSISRHKKNGRVTLTLGVLQDITEKRNYEQNLQAAKDSLEDTVRERTRQLADTVERLQLEITERKNIASELEAKNAELERFAYTVSHDLKTPLVTIKGFLGLLDRDLSSQDSTRARADMARINEAADNMGHMLEELLELSRIGQVMGETQSRKLTELAQQARQMFEVAAAKQGVEIDVDDMPEVSVDPTRIIEVYQNLIENALKFMGDQTAPRIHIGAKLEPDRVCCFVSDNGIGIATEYHTLIFNLFERLSGDVEGSGVGLTLVKRIVETHGGEVWIESDGENRGCSLWFSLPRKT